MRRNSYPCRMANCSFKLSGGASRAVLKSCRAWSHHRVEDSGISATHPTRARVRPLAYLADLTQIHCRQCSIPHIIDAIACLKRTNRGLAGHGDDDVEGLFVKLEVGCRLFAQHVPGAISSLMRFSGVRPYLFTLQPSGRDRTSRPRVVSSVDWRGSGVSTCFDFLSPRRNMPDLLYYQLHVWSIWNLVERDAGRHLLWISTRAQILLHFSFNFLTHPQQGDARDVYASMHREKEYMWSRARVCRNKRVYAGS